MVRAVILGLLGFIFVGVVSAGLVFAAPEATGQVVRVKERNGVWVGTMYGSTFPIRISQDGDFVLIRSEQGDDSHPSLAWDTVSQQMTIACVAGRELRITQHGNEARGECREGSR